MSRHRDVRRQIDEAYEDEFAQEEYGYEEDEGYYDEQGRYHEGYYDENDEWIDTKVYPAEPEHAAVPVVEPLAPLLDVDSLLVAQAIAASKAETPSPATTTDHKRSSNSSNAVSKSNSSSSSSVPETKGQDKKPTSFARPNLDVSRHAASKAKSKGDSLVSKLNSSPSSLLVSSPGGSTRSNNSNNKSRQSEKKLHRNYKPLTVKQQQARTAKLNQLDKQSSGKLHVNMVVIGHVDAGKSTLMGHLLFDAGYVSERTMQVYEQEAKQMGKASFVFAWVLDEGNSERAHGVTVDVAVSRFETDTKDVTLLDAPGHKDFIPNMIAGAAQADAGILVVPATPNEFESAFTDSGQTKEHAILARSLGVSQLIVAVSKMDMVQWSQERYEEVLAQLSGFLTKIGFRQDDVRYVPVSGWTGEHLIKRNPENALSDWYNGPTLIELIDTFDSRDIQASKAAQQGGPFRMSISDVFRTQLTGVTLCGKVLSGAVLPKDQVLITPVNHIASVKSIQRQGETTPCARVGDNVEICIGSGLEPAVEQAIAGGQFLCDPAAPLVLARKIKAQIVTLQYESSIPLLKGTEVVFFTQNNSVEAVITKLVHVLEENKETGVRGERLNPRSIGRKQTALVHILLSKSICMERYKKNKTLGRFALRREDETVAVGVAVKLYEEHHHSLRKLLEKFKQ